MSFFDYFSSVSQHLRGSTQGRNGSLIQNKGLLEYLSLALNKDFDRYASLIKNKIYLEEGISCVSSSQPQNITSRSEVLHSTPPKQNSNLVQKDFQRAKKTEKKKNTKVDSKKTIQITSTVSNTKPKKTEKPISKSKQSKKITKAKAKVTEVRKQTDKKFPTIITGETAEMTRFGLDERQVNRKREKLLMRRVFEWADKPEMKRGRYEFQTN